MSSPVSRTMQMLRDQGAIVDITQRSIPTKPFPTSKDLFGVADLEALFPSTTLYVQVCRDEDLPDHFSTCLYSATLPVLIGAPGRYFEIWSWAKRAGRGRRELWSPKVYAALLGSRGRVSFIEVPASGWPEENAPETLPATESPMGLQTSALEKR